MWNQGAETIAASSPNTGMSLPKTKPHLRTGFASYCFMKVYVSVRETVERLEMLRDKAARKVVRYYGDERSIRTETRIEGPNTA